MHETPVEDFEAQLRLNLRPTYLVCHAAIPHLQAAGGGAIVCVSSRAALKPFAGAAGYIVAKAAVLAFVDVLAAEYRDDGIRANAILPSVIDTPANRASMPDADHEPLGRAGADRERRAVSLRGRRRAWSAARTCRCTAAPDSRPACPRLVRAGYIQPQCPRGAFVTLVLPCRGVGHAPSPASAQPPLPGERIAAGVTAAGTDLAGLTVDEAAAKLQSIHGERLERGTDHRAGGGHHVDAEDVDAAATFDALTSAKRALYAGRDAAGQPVDVPLAGELHRRAPSTASSRRIEQAPAAARRATRG